MFILMKVKINKYSSYLQGNIAGMRIILVQVYF